MELILNLIILLVILGVVYWLINYLIPLPPIFRTIVNVLLGLFLFFWLLNLFFGISIANWR